MVAITEVDTKNQQLIEGGFDDPTIVAQNMRELNHSLRLYNGANTIASGIS